MIDVLHPTPSPADIRRAIRMAEAGTWVHYPEDDPTCWACYLIEPDGRRFCNGDGHTAADAMALAWLHRWAPEALDHAYVEDGTVPISVPDGYRFELTPPLHAFDSRKANVSSARLLPLRTGQTFTSCACDAKCANADS